VTGSLLGLGLTGWSVVNVAAIQKGDQIQHVGMAVDLWLFKKIHQRPSFNSSNCSSGVHLGITCVP
jgi:hypothetical protein